MTETEDILNELNEIKSDSSDDSIEIKIISKFDIFNYKNYIIFSVPKKTLLFDLENKIANILVDYPLKRQLLSLKNLCFKEVLYPSTKLINDTQIYLEPRKIIVIFTFRNMQGLAGEFFHFETVLDIKNGIYNLFSKYKHINLDITKIKLFFDEIDIFINYQLDDNKKLFEYDYVNPNNDEYWKKLIMNYDDLE